VPGMDATIYIAPCKEIFGSTENFCGKARGDSRQSLYIPSLQPSLAMVGSRLSQEMRGEEGG
jgi:hypothetical protein